MQWSSDMREISGFGGGYEEACQRMVRAEVGVGPGVAGLVHGAAPPDPEPPADNVVCLQSWAERRGRWSAVPASVGRRAA